jgi:hypothetical protein
MPSERQLSTVFISKAVIPLSPHSAGFAHSGRKGWHLGWAKSARRIGYRVQ